jgi:predicted RNA-binding protein YlqC (UPF0109 family)
MKALIEYLARAIVEHPDEVRVVEAHDGDRVISSGNNNAVF